MTMMDAKFPPCTSGFKNCNGVCFELVYRGAECPINDLRILTNSEAQNWKNQLPFGNSHKIIWSNTAENQAPVTDVTLSLDTPCSASYFQQAGIDDLKSSSSG